MSQPPQQQTPPGTQRDMDPRPDCGEESYQGHGRLTGKAAVITGGDSGIGRAVAIAYAREGADVVISYLSEHEDAKDTARLVEEAGQRAVLVAGDLASPQHCRDVVATAVRELGKVDVLVNNAAYQMSHDTLEEISDDEWDHTWATNVSAMFHLTKAVLPHMPSGGSIIGSSSVNSDSPSPTLAPYATTKAAIANLSPAWPSCSASAVSGSTVSRPARSGRRSSLRRCRRRRSSTSARTPRSAGRDSRPSSPLSYVLLASDEASYISGARLAVTGGRPVL